MLLLILNCSALNASEQICSSVFSNEGHDTSKSRASLLASLERELAKRGGKSHHFTEAALLVQDFLSEKIQTNEPQPIAGYAYYKGKFYPSSYYRNEGFKETLAGQKYRARPSERGSSMWYLETTTTRLIRRKRGGSRAFLDDYIVDHPTVTVYRATSPEEAWSSAQLRECLDSQESAEPKDFEAAAYFVGSLSDVRRKWSGPIKKTDLAKLVIDSKDFKLNPFVTPSRTAAETFVASLNKTGKPSALIEYRLDLTRLSAEEKSQIYFGTENWLGDFYIEMAFDGPAAKEFLIRALAATQPLNQHR